VRQRADLRFPPGGAVLRVGDRAATALWRGGLLRAKPVAERHALRLEAGRVGVAMLSAMTSMARCCATRREVATLEAMSMAAIPGRFDGAAARGVPPTAPRACRRKLRRDRFVCDVCVRACVGMCAGGSYCRMRLYLPGGLFKTSLPRPRRSLNRPGGFSPMHELRTTHSYRSCGAVCVAPCPR